MSDLMIINSELTRFRDVRRRLLEADRDYSDDLVREAIEGVNDLQGAIQPAVLSALEDEEAASRLRGRLDEMEARLGRLEASLDGLEAPGVRIVVRRVPPVIVVSDECLIPEDYQVPRPARINYQAIRDALTGGAEVPVAVLAEPEPYLSVRTG